MEKQVDKSHYQFSKYVSKKRWASIWHQIQEVVSLAPENILKIGPGPDIFKQILSHLGFSVDTVDVDPELKPDFVTTAAQLPFKLKITPTIAFMLFRFWNISSMTNPLPPLKKWHG